MLTLDKLCAAVKVLERHRLEPLVIETEEQARQMKGNDPLKRQWKVGDKFYVVDQNGWVASDTGAVCMPPTK